MCAGVTEEICTFTSFISSFEQASSHTVLEGVTHGISPKGSQTGNSSGCFQDLLACLSK